MKGPRGMIAEAIADALAEFFVVDQAAMETRLLSNAQIVLHDTELKPQVLELSPEKGLTAAISGIVGEVAFEWHWGHDDIHQGGSTWVKDAKLTISGLRFTAILSERKESEDEQSHIKPGEDEHKVEEEPKGLMGYVLDQVQRIIDTLTLSITDFEFTVKPPSGEQSLEIIGTGLELSSMGHIENEPLNQQLVIATIFANVHVDDDEDAFYPLLDPVRYKASCVRTFGKRFLDGIDKGLQITGESNDKGLVLHLGDEQIRLLNSLVGYFLQMTSAEEKADDADSTQLAKSEGKDTKLCKNPSTFFQLPLSTVSFVFPNETKISLSGLVAKYQMDGKVLSIEGHDGFLVNDFPVFKVGDTSLWCADIVRSTVQLFDTAAGSPNEHRFNDIVAFVHAREGEIENLKEGIDQVINVYQSLTDGAAAFFANEADANDPSQQSTPWSFELTGQLGFLWEGENDDVEAELTVRGIRGSAETFSAQIDAIEQFYMPGIIKLVDPIENTNMTFDGTIFDITVGSIVATLEEPMPPKDEKSPISPKSNAHKTNSPPSFTQSISRVGSDVSKAEPFILPFGVKATVDSVIIFDAEWESNHTIAKDLRLALGPDAEKLGGIRTALTVNSIDNDMISLQKPCLSGLLFLDNLDFVPQFNFDAKHVAVAAGYTALDWKRLFDVEARRKRQQKLQNKKKKKKEPIMMISMPFAHVEPLKIKIIISGDVVGFKESVMHISAFNGRAGTTSDDLIAFYTSRVVSRVPNMITNANVFGADVKENVVSHFGGAAGTATLVRLGAAAGSVGGVLSLAAFDGVRNTIKAGKKSRGAEPDDRYRAGDIARGLKEAAVDATRGGAKRRGKVGDQRGNPLDWAVGATADVAKYTHENKSRLGGAGAGTVGFTVGMAMGGPLGAVTGAIIASVATAKTIDVVSDTITRQMKKSRVKRLLKVADDDNDGCAGQGVEYTVAEMKAKEQEDRKAENSFEVSLSENPIPLRGIMLKRRDFFQWHWRSHYFVLDEDVIEYYDFQDTPLQGEEDDSGKEEETDGMLYIDDTRGPLKTLNIASLSAKADDSLSKPAESLFVFTINSQAKKHIWVLAAASENTRDKWVSRIGAVHCS